MKRLIYAPKAYIFIRSSNLGGRIYDVTSDVARGEVTQNTGDVSKANFELRNRYQKWLRDDESGGKSIFLPMDMVTIWLQRIAGRPIQVFTGYLDTVPYYQGYPGNAVFEATCTLKKLAFTWFDPGLQFFQSWIMSTAGWTYNPQTGEATNPQYITQAELIDPNKALTDSGAVAKVNDGGFAELLGRFMVEVAGWDNNDVLISEMPKDIPKLAAKLYADIHSQTESDLTNLEQFLGQAMGLKGWANLDAQTVTTADGTPAQNSAITAVVGQIKTVADKYNVPLIVPVLAAYILSGFQTNKSVASNSGQTNWGYGLYSLQPKASQAGIAPDPFGSTLTTPDIDGKTIDQLTDASVSTEVFCKRLLQYPQYAAAARNNDLNSIQTWIESALGRKLPKVDMTTILAKAKQYAAISVVVTPPAASPNQAIDAANFDFSSMLLQGLLTDKDKQVIRDHYKGAHPWLAAILYRAKQSNRSITISPHNNNANQILLAGPAGALDAFFSALTGDTTIDQVELGLNGKLKMLKNGVVSNIPGATVTSNSNNVMAVVQSKKPASAPSLAAGTSASTDSSATNQNAAAGGVTFTQLAAFSANSAFAANFSFPANALEAMFLTGDKALMNDVSCLDAVKQFCKASLRTFRSLPDGRFLAFYPDYFGAYRKPYWQIYNIEITNFGIQLNDDALATHVYVTGDTAYGDGQIDQYDMIASRGVATITQAFMLNSFIQPYTPPKDKKGTLVQPKLGRLQDAYSFLQHYGARPHKEEEPLIRNTFYEFLMAWQRFMQLWSQQFATTVTFTFQPEVMAGGLIEFPDHDIQMFCESVTHTFDYTSAFETSAVMTAPALTTANNDPTHMPGFALAGGVNTVGVGSG